MPGKLVQEFLNGSMINQYTVLITDLQVERDGQAATLQAVLNRTNTMIADLQTLQTHGTALSNTPALLTLVQTRVLGQDINTLATDMIDLVRVVRALLLRELDPT